MFRYRTPTKFLRLLLSSVALLALVGCTGPIVEELHPDGSLAARGRLLPGEATPPIRHGVWETWYPDSVRKSHARYTRGKRCGVYREWHPNGQLALQESTDWDEKLHGISTRWDAEGQRLSLVHYEHGEEQHRVAGPTATTAVDGS